MKNKPLYLGILVILAVGAYFIVSQQHPTTQNITSYQPPITQKCPDDYSKDDVGSAERQAALEKWSDDFYNSYPEATIVDWADARHQFWVDNNCTAALQRYQDVLDGKADPVTVERVKNALQDVIDSPTP
jgi:hypothetical protein